MSKNKFSITLSDGINEVPVTIHDRVIFRRLDGTELEIREINETIQVGATAFRGASCLRVIPQASNVVRIVAERGSKHDNTQQE